MILSAFTIALIPWILLLFVLECTWNVSKNRLDTINPPQLKNLILYVPLKIMFAPYELCNPEVVQSLNIFLAYKEGSDRMKGRPPYSYSLTFSETHRQGMFVQIHKDTNAPRGFSTVPWA
jgi:hypothetical protein